MGAPDKGIEAAEQPAAESLLSAFKTIGDPERRRHASLLNYWLSIRGDKEFPPLHDLDPLEISDAGPSSILLELASGGHDAQVRHMGEALGAEAKVEQIIDAPSPSVLASIAKKLPLVAISRDFLAFEDEFETDSGSTRCWVTLLPLSAGGAWVDYVYAMVTVEGSGEAPVERAEAAIEETLIEGVEAAIGETPIEEAVEESPAGEISEEAVADVPEEPIAAEIEPFEEPAAEAQAPVDEQEPFEDGDDSSTKPGFAKLFDSIVGLTNFYGSQPVRVDPVLADEEPTPVEEQFLDDEPPAEAVADAPNHESPSEPEALDEAVPEHSLAEDLADEPVTAAEEAPPENSNPAPALEGTLQSKLAEVRSKADEARQAKLRANAALYEGLSAAYDFALDAEDAPEEYLRLVEAQGLKIQLRSSMKPVVKLAFDGLCDDSMIKQLEAVLAWAFEEELPRGTLAERIQAAGGIAPILSGEAAAAA